MEQVSTTGSAVMAWRAALGQEQVCDDPDVLDRYGRSTQGAGTRPQCILYPRSVDDVREIVRIAQDSSTVVYPISRGKNWGYGDACAPTAGAAIVDMSRMNRIIEVNAELAYAVIEPGVTQGQLFAYLRDNHIPLWLDSTGAGPDASLVGNTLDRGFGHTRYSDHVRTSCAMEIVLADGRILNTGYAHFPNAQASHVFPYGIGPSLDGLFCQSNLGIITKLTLWLQPKPEAFAFFYIRVERHDALGALVDALRPLRLRGELESALHIANDLRLLSANGRYPWDEAGGTTPLPLPVRERMRKALDAGAWTAGGSISGSKSRVRGAKQALRRAAQSIGARVNFVDDSLISLAERAQRALSWIGFGEKLADQLRTLKPNYGLLKGEPTNEPLRGTHWRLRKPPASGSLDPLDVGAGLVWLSPVLPMTGSAARRLVDLVEPIYAEFGFEPLVTVTLINERAMIAILNVSFDQSVSDERDRALACYDKLMSALIETGYYPYRTSPKGMARMRNDDDVFWDVASKLKTALDPGDIIARGRYIPPLGE